MASAVPTARVLATELDRRRGALCPTERRRGLRGLVGRSAPVDVRASDRRDHGRRPVRAFGRDPLTPPRRPDIRTAARAGRRSRRHGPAGPRSRGGARGGCAPRAGSCWSSAATRPGRSGRSSANAASGTPTSWPTRTETSGRSALSWVDVRRDRVPRSTRSVQGCGPDVLLRGGRPRGGRRRHRGRHRRSQASRTPKELPLAALPLLFGIHQLVEAFVWWGLAGKVPSMVGDAATWLYLAVAFALPFWVPFAVRGVETSRRRRTVITVLGGAGSSRRWSCSAPSWSDRSTPRSRATTSCTGLTSREAPHQHPVRRRDVRRAADGERSTDPGLRQCRTCSRSCSWCG